MAKLTLSILTLLSFMSLFGCSGPTLLKQAYPSWGREIQLPTKTDDAEQQRYLQLLEPQNAADAEACILIVHGMNEYVGRYAEIAHYFADRAIVAGIDLSAHGLSNPVIAHAHRQIKAGKGEQDIRNAFLQQAKLVNLQPMRDDFGRALTYLLQNCGRGGQDKQLPVFILSHSLGSLVAASWLMKPDNTALKNRVNGIIFTGPAFSVTEVPGWRGWFQNPLVHFSYHTHEHFLNPHDEALPLMLFNQLLSLITVPLQDGVVELLSLPGLRNLFSPSTPDWVINFLTDWQEERERHQVDPLIIRRSVLRYVLAVEKAIIAFREQMADFETPYLLIYSEQDPITPAWGNTDFAAATYDNHPHNKVMMLAGANHHEQLFSAPPLRNRILKAISAWIDLRKSQTDRF